MRICFRLFIPVGARSPDRDEGMDKRNNMKNKTNSSMKIIWLILFLFPLNLVAEVTISGILTDAAECFQPEK
jgi:hypothetical protein